MTRTFGSGGDRKKFTLSWWLKRASAGFGNNQYYFFNTASHTGPLWW